MDPARILRFAAVFTLLLVLQALFASGLVNPYYVRVLILCCFSVMLAVSLNIIIGYAGQFSIGHAGFYAVGAYTAGAFTVYAGPPIRQALALDRLPGWLEGTAFLIAAICVGTLFAALAGLAVGLPSLRLRGDYLAIATLGFGEMIRVVIQNVEAVGGRVDSAAYPSIPASSGPRFLRWRSYGSLATWPAPGTGARFWPSGRMRQPPVCWASMSQSTRWPRSFSALRWQGAPGLCMRTTKVIWNPAASISSAASRSSSWW